MNFTYRGYTTLIDSYLNPIIKKYTKDIENKVNAKKIFYMQSNGLLVDNKNFNGRNAILSGPAAGVNGGIHIAKKNNIKNLIGFDMGGTSADIWHYNGSVEKKIETKLSGLLIKTPSLLIDSIASGGGSITKYEDNRFVVGPESAGSFPGPACYRNNGPLTLTDCNLVLGRISKEEFPKFFGKNKNLSINEKDSVKKLKLIFKKVKKNYSSYQNIYQIAESFINVAIEKMSSAIKKITIQKGFDIRNYSLLIFGSASGQYCCKIAENIGVKRIIFNPFSSVLSAYGLGKSSLGTNYQISIEKPLSNKQINYSIKKVVSLIQDPNYLKTNFILRLKYIGSNTLISLVLKEKKANIIKLEFFTKHQRLFGFNYKNKKIIIDSIEAEVFFKIKKTSIPLLENSGAFSKKIINKKIYFGTKWINVKKLNKNNFLKNSKTIKGPAIFSDYNTTIVIEKNWSIKKLKTETFLLVKNQEKRRKYQSAKKPNPEMLEVFNNLFYSTAEQMGIVLRNTAQSINVKERLDFSCALFNEKGELIANAPHIPIHLGAMSDTIKYLIKKHYNKLKKGTSLLHNNPFSGGTHLPDLTVVTPYLNKNNSKVLYYFANRAHHSDIGGITPGSMPAFSKNIHEEGIIFDGFPILVNKRIKEKEIINFLKNHVTPSRDPYQNLYDIRAQLAANQKGINEIERIINNYGPQLVKKYVNYVQKNCREIISKVLKNIISSNNFIKIDNGAIIKVKLYYNKIKKKLEIDFSGTSKQLLNNFNAPEAVTKSVVIYFLRSLIENDIPLNEGFLKDVDIIIPKNSMLNPIYPAPVVAGNVETSQNLIDLLNTTIKVQASCYGTMSNIAFGNKYFGYYETICGGEGASKGNNGNDAVHCHMTNTSITDPEILEWFYPVRLREFSIRKLSGGKGKWSGGNGVIRKIEFLKNLDLSILSNRRIIVPPGINKAGSGKKGINLLITSDKHKLKLNYSSQIKVKKGDILIIQTPGGGAYN